MQCYTFAHITNPILYTHIVHSEMQRNQSAKSETSKAADMRVKFGAKPIKRTPGHNVSHMRRKFAEQRPDSGLSGKSKPGSTSSGQTHQSMGPIKVYPPTETRKFQRRGSEIDRWNKPAGWDVLRRDLQGEVLRRDAQPEIPSKEELKKKRKGSIDFRYHKKPIQKSWTAPGPHWDQNQPNMPTESYTPGMSPRRTGPAARKNPPVRAKSDLSVEFSPMKRNKFQVQLRKVQKLERVQIKKLHRQHTLKLEEEENMKMSKKTFEKKHSDLLTELTSAMYDAAGTIAGLAQFNDDDNQRDTDDFETVLDKFHQTNNSKDKDASSVSNASSWLSMDVVQGKVDKKNLATEFPPQTFIQEVTLVGDKSFKILNPQKPRFTQIKKVHAGSHESLDVESSVPSEASYSSTDEAETQSEPAISEKLVSEVSSASLPLLEKFVDKIPSVVKLNCIKFKRLSDIHECDTSIGTPGTSRSLPDSTLPFPVPPKTYKSLRSLVIEDHSPAHDIIVRSMTQVREFPYIQEARNVTILQPQQRKNKNKKGSKHTKFQLQNKWSLRAQL